jgi:cell pole-organizing protein PopZ
MQSREPSMEDILASIKRVIAEEKELRAAVGPESDAKGDAAEEEVLELDETMEAEGEPAEAAEPLDLGPPLLDENAAGSSRQALDELSDVAAHAPPPQPSANPLEDMLREMLRPVLKQWLDENLPRIVDEHVKREISRITGRPL